MKLYFENNTGPGNRWELPKTFQPTFSRMSRRKRFRPRYGMPGSVSSGDGQIEGRQISFTDLQASGTGTEQEKDEAYRAAITGLIEFFEPDLKPFFLVDTDALSGSGLRCEIDYLDHENNFLEGNILRVGRPALELEMMTPLWDDETIRTVTEAGPVSNGHTVVIDNSAPAFPDLTTGKAFTRFEISILNTAGNITFRNAETGQFFTYESIAMGAGMTLILDGTGQEFIVTLEGAQTDIALADGSGPMQLQTGINTISLESDLGVFSYVIKYRRRFSSP